MPAAVGVAVAGILLAWLTYQQRTINAASLAAAFGPICQRRARGLRARRRTRPMYQDAVLGFSRGVGWIDRYLVDGVVNVVSAWTLDAGDGLRRMQIGSGQDYVYGVPSGLLPADGCGAGARLG